MAAAASAVAFAAWWATQPSADQLAQAARRALTRGRPDEARQLAKRAVSRNARSSVARLAAAEVELDANQPEAALAHLEQVRDDGSAAAQTAIGNAGDILFRLNRLDDAERRFRRILELDPRSLLARKRLALLMALAGRRLEATRLYLEIVQSGQFDTHELALLGDAEQVYDNPEYIQRFSGSVHNDPLLLEASARYALYRHEVTRALVLYRQLMERSPFGLDAQAGFGRALVDSEQNEEFLKWNASLPAAAEKHPDIWEARGRFAQKQREPLVAVRCYVEAIRRDPNMRHAHYQLTVLLRQLGDHERLQVVQTRTDQLIALSETLALVHFDGGRVDLLQRAGELCAALGRPWESWGWLQALAATTGRRDLRVRAEQLFATLGRDTPRVLPAGQLAVQFELSDFPLPVWRARRSTAGPVSSHRESRWMDRVTFDDIAPEAGLEFTYHKGVDSTAPGMRIWQGPGGGVAVIDFDVDAWPDLYLTQGCDWPPDPNQTKYLDRMFRNLGGGGAVDVTARARLGDERYSHGATAGDFDSDGFPDLYVANIGSNRLYRNNGDGTFTDCTVTAGVVGDHWSTSCMLADLNADGLPEIYDVTYLGGREPFELVCHDKQRNNAPRTCSPAVFAAEQDRLFLNRGDGTFENISDRAGIEAPDGKGLGLVAADFDGSNRLSLYVANDTTPNFLFLNRLSRPGDLPTFVEQGIISGCAVDSEGRAQASMGIAIDDSDGDGLPDLFVTNFHNEYNVLYRLQPGGIFNDASSTARLKEPSLPMLGFGTQFLDADLDGWPDLVVANGHVDDFSDHGIPYRMRAQFFGNAGGGQFVELPPSQLGDYFRQELLGRGLALLDWNRDGREDFAVSNLEMPAALVINRTLETGRSVTLRLCGVASNRDAIGTVLRFTAAGRSRVKQLTGGDGYQASNQRLLVLGLGDDPGIAELVVRWPSGREQTFRNLAAGGEYLLVEGRSDRTRLESQP
jgi:tetratricopeptide (TPR) repeat protein